MLKASISRLFIDKEVAGSQLALSIEKRLGISPEILDESSKLFRLAMADDDHVKKGKEVLFLTKNKGPFIKKCPGTREYICCGYKILHIGTFCTMDCAYCILQSYFHPPVLQYFLNFDQMMTELDIQLKAMEISRIGTGEFTDSLIWETVSELNADLVNKFSTQDHGVLELKSKAVAISGFKNLAHNRKTIMAWSLNTERVITGEERKTTPLASRLEAAARCESWGYPVAFHFDPMVIYNGCEEEYKDVIRRIFTHVSPENIVWISLGTFRFMPDLKAIVQQRFPFSKIIYGEFIQGLDGKMRYFKPLRIALYKKIVSSIREIAPDVLVYFCMEDEEVWEKSMGFVPEEKGGLKRMLDQSAAVHCGLDMDLL